MVSSPDPEAFSASLDWRQFESFAETAFKSLGYRTTRNFRLKKPRAEIDLIAVREQIAFGVDCKHWRRTVGRAAMINIGENQIRRCKFYLRSSSVERIIPVILTWHDEFLEVLENGVAVVPIQKISDFLLNWESSRDKIKVLARRVRNRRATTSIDQRIHHALI